MSNTIHSTIVLLVTSRFYDSIAREIEGYSKLIIGANNDDINAYVARRINKGPRLERLVIKDALLSKEIEKTVVENTQNM